MPTRSWKFHSGRLLTAVALILIVAWLTGHPIAVAGSAAVAYSVWHLVNLWRLYRWLEKPGETIPESFGIWRDIYDSIASLQKSNERRQLRFERVIREFRSLTDAFPDATLVIDENDALTWFNTSAGELLGLESPGDLGQAATNFLRGPNFANWLAVEHEVRAPLEMPSPRNDDRWLHANAVSFRENQRLIILRDVTEVHNVEKIRRDFVANISHELRTPLTVLQGYLELLDNHSSSDVAEAVSRMLIQTGQMQNLLDDLLELSRLQNDDQSGQDEWVNVPAMLMQLKEQAVELSRGKHELIFKVQPDLFLSGIPADLESAFSNLIRNAVKYTPKKGSVTVTWEEGADGPRLIVRDTGIGIPRRDLPRVTERFYRVGSDRAKQSGGTGLGLAIVKHVLNAHQAKLTIESELGEGSEFICSFPRDRMRNEDINL